MESKPRQKMSVEQRAKQFMPFAALPGLVEALARVEEEMAFLSDTPDRSDPNDDTRGSGLYDDTL